MMGARRCCTEGAGERHRGGRDRPARPPGALPPRRRRPAARPAARHREHRRHLVAGGRRARGAPHRHRARPPVIAPHLLGHGASAKPRGDYSLGAYASGVRDLVAALGFDRATVVGHSLGGGIAMQFAYQFPERIERLVLISSGGLGREVHLILRAATLPGSELVLALLGGAWLRATGGALGGAVGRLGLKTGEDLGGVASGIGSLADAGARGAFVQTARAAIDAGGQRVSAPPPP